MLVDEFSAAARNLDPAEVSDVVDALDVLENWDRNFDAESVGAILFSAWRAFDARTTESCAVMYRLSVDTVLVKKRQLENVIIIFWRFTR